MSPNLVGSMNNFVKKDELGNYGQSCTLVWMPKKTEIQIMKNCKTHTHQSMSGLLNIDIRMQLTSKTF